MRFDDTELQHLLTWVQDGVVSRRQILEFGGSDGDIKRMLRRRELTRVFPGVFVNHTGRLSRSQYEHAAVLWCWPAALGFESALGQRPLDGRVRVVIPSGRQVKSPRGIRVQAISDFDGRVDDIASPPRVRFAEAAIDAAAERDEAGALTLLSEALWTRRTTVAELRRVLGARARVPRRGMLTDLLRDLEEGTCSVLERGYLHLVERPHGLPKMNRQVRDVLDGRTLYRDGEYAAYGLVIELDGLAHHSGAEARARDSVRDLETLAERGELTVRLTHRQVFREHCRSAALVGKILQRQGWPGRPKRCPLCPGR